METNNDIYIFLYSVFQCLPAYYGVIKIGPGHCRVPCVDKRDKILMEPDKGVVFPQA